MSSNWTIKKSEQAYRIGEWGAGYFSVSDSGEVIVTPDGTERGPTVSLHKIAEGIEERGLSMPVLLRIENILASQIRKLHSSFRLAIEELGYNGTFSGVFPVKVNQQEHVLETIADVGKEFNHGFEAGSKPELIAAISLLGNRDACLVCNGYKDEEFIDIALLATKMGLNCFLVVEMPNELDLILERAKFLKIKPNLGVRVKLTTKAEGKWSESGGEASVFGLTMSQIIDVVDKLKNCKMLDCLKLLHYHIGSQIPNIGNIRAGVQEACRVYEELVNEDAPMGFLDLGGGLAVDYDGSKNSVYTSRNYSVDEYCYDVVETVMSSFAGKDVPHPTIITESGRATVAYYSVLLFNILDVSSCRPHELVQQLPDETNLLLKNFHAVLTDIREKNCQESLNDANFYREQASQLFKYGELSLRERAIAEDFYRHCIIKIREITKDWTHVSDAMSSLDKSFSDVYYGNFSLFQSLPDVWAINQVFPVMPIHRLSEEPTRPAVIADITCDCDGKIDLFPGDFHHKKNLLLHELRDKEEYYLGVFLVGAYQETLGDLHNLFGDTNVVSVDIRQDGSFDIIRELEGDSVADVLSYVEYDLNAIKKRITKLAEDAIRLGLISTKDRRYITQAFTEGLRGYTYFEREYKN